MCEKRCGNCKYLKVIISQMSDYLCFKNKEYMNIDDLSSVCDSFVFDDVPLSIKEEKVWG